MAPPRTFDWQEAQRLRKQGLSFGKIAERLGTTPSAARGACLTESQRKQKRESDLAFVRARRARGLYYEYDTCSCGGRKDSRRRRCLRCRRADEKLLRDLASAERSRIEAAHEELYLRTLELRRGGLSYKAIAAEIGIARSTVRNWCTRKPARFKAPGRSRSPRRSRAGTA